MSFDLTPQLNVKSTNMAYPYNESATETKNGGERWYALSFALPPSWPLDSTTPVTVASIDVGLVSAGLAPPLAIVVKGRDILLDMHFEQATPDTATSSRKIPVVLDQVRRDTWYCFVIHANWSSTLNSGALMVWNNHELVYQTTRLHNSYKPQYLNVPFVGLSVPEKNDALPRKIYTDVIWLGKPGATTTHKQMRDATPCL